MPAIPQPSLTPTLVFLAIVLALALGLVAAARGAGGQRSAVTAVLVGAWLALTAGLALGGVLDTDGPLPAPFHRLMLASAVATLALCLGSPGLWLLRALPLWQLVGFQAFRVPLELVLWQLAREGALPVQMTFEGRNWDVLSGLLAIPLAAALRRGPVPRGWVLAWNVLGLGLLGNIVQVAVRSTPGALRAFANDPPNVLVFAWPWVWLPTVCVLAALAGHLLVFRWLWRGARPHA